VLSVPFAAAYFHAYEGVDAHPFWLAPMERALAPLLEFASPPAVYETYGRIYAVVFVLYLPATIALHRLRSGRSSRLESVGFALVVGALVITAIGVAGDYWADGAGYTLELIGLLVLAVGSSVWGLGVRLVNAAPEWWTWLLIAVGPLAVAFLFVFGHLPSGPGLPVAGAWLLLGCLFLAGRIGKPQAHPVSS
jgi:hypothetical protein